MTNASATSPAVAHRARVASQKSAVDARIPSTGGVNAATRLSVASVGCPPLATSAAPPIVTSKRPA